MTMTYEPPFPYFGGKSRVADVVWQALGDPANFIEAFAGSAAVLFMRPHEPQTETINDADGFVANFWRAMQKDSDAVAQHADSPVLEVDLHSRHLWLLGQREKITDRLCGDPDYYDAKAAGWWAWGQSCWIGGGWCSGDGPWISENGVMVLGNAGGVNKGVHRQLPHLSDAGMGVNRGAHRKRPHLGDAGRGVNRQGGGGLKEYLGGLAARLRRVRVCCGDWQRVCGPSVTFTHGVTGVFLDPPYSESSGRDMRCYAIDCGEVAHRVREWAVEQGENPLMRIVLAGYEGEHDMPDDWRKHEWATRGGYGSPGDGAARVNRFRERLWFSPHCLRDEGLLFGDWHENDPGLPAVV
jgi:DNA adenine methylase